MDLDYIEDSGADTDMNLSFWKIMGLLRFRDWGKAFTAADFSKMIARAEIGIENILSIQRKMLGELAA